MVSRKLGKGTVLEIETCSYVRTTNIHLGRYPSHSLIVISLSENWGITFALFFEIFIFSLTWDTAPPAHSALLLLAARNPGVTAVWRKPIQFGEFRICHTDSAAESLRVCCFFKSESPLFMLSAALIWQYFPNAFLHQSSASPLLEEIPTWEHRSPAAVCECLLASCH